MFVAAGATVVAAGVAAGAQAYSANKAAKSAKDAANAAANAPTVSYNPTADPVMGAISMESLLGLGRGDAGMAQASSPLAVVLNTMHQSGSFKQSDVQLVTDWLGGIAQTGVMPDPFGNMKDYRSGFEAVVKALALAGYTNLPAFAKAQQDYNTQSAALDAQLAPLRDQILQGRISAYGGISKIAQDYPGASASDILSLQNQYEQQIRSGINQDVTDQQAQINQAANMNRGNPAATLGRLAQQQLLSQQAAPTTALERALQMLQGKETLANTAISGYQSVLDPGNQLALSVAGLRANAATQAASLMSGQNQNNTNLQAQLAQSAGNSQAAGIAGAGNSIASGVSSAAQNYQNSQQMAALIAAFKGSSGGPGATYGSGATFDNTGLSIFPRSTV